MARHPARHRPVVGSTVALVALLPFGGCGDSDPVAPAPSLASITVSAPVGEVLAAGATVALTAVALDSRGAPLLVSLTWSSSAASVATVDGDGVVSATGPGTVRIEARSGAVAGHIDFTVREVATASVRALLADPFTVAVVEGAAASGEDPADAMALADAALSAGDVLVAEGAFRDIRDMATATTDPDARALLAVLVLIVDHAQRQLGL
jgi:hypothetical protein